MNKYIVYWRPHKQHEHAQLTIRLIIYHDAGREELNYALDEQEGTIWIAKYKLKLLSYAKMKKSHQKILKSKTGYT